MPSIVPQAPDMNTYMQLEEAPYFGIADKGTLMGFPAMHIICHKGSAGKPYKIQTLFERLQRHIHNLVVIAGDAPMSQRNIAEILRMFDLGQFKTQVECSGEEPVANYLGLRNVRFYITITTPSMGDVSKNDLGALNHLRPFDTVVFPINSMADYTTMSQIIKTYRTKANIELKAGDKFAELEQLLIDDKELAAMYKEQSKFRIIY